MTSTTAIEIARRSLLAPTGLENRDLDHALGALMRGGVDAADLYFQVSRHEGWSLEDGIVKDASHSIEQGVGVRAISGEKTGFAYSDELLVPALMQAAHSAGAIARTGAGGSVQAWSLRKGHELYGAADPIVSMSDDDKVGLLQRVDQATRAIDPRVRQVMASLAAAHEVVLVCSSDGVMAADVRPLVRMNVSVIVEQDGRREQGYAGGGARASLPYFLESDRAFEIGREAVRQALVALEAVPAPAGEMVVVLGPGWPGVL
ncbi:MAG: metalloprotease TldD, partial [Gammaproteobacteria bacterium]|nr:metalloprotease TldD [Gammaproteobacteria bacterium]